MPERCSAASRMVLLGMVPVLMQAPPITSFFSMTAARLPSLAAWKPARCPPGPEPMTTRSYFCIAVFLDGESDFSYDETGMLWAERIPFFQFGLEPFTHVTGARGHGNNSVPLVSPAFPTIPRRGEPSSTSGKEMCKSLRYRTIDFASHSIHNFMSITCLKYCW